MMYDASRPFGIRDKVGYLLGNLACDLSFSFAGVFLLVFYTKVLGIPGALVGTMFLIARFVDAFTDVAMGRIVDKVTFKHGKFRPWIIRMAAPVAIASFLMYQSSLATAPFGIRVTYMIVTYFLWGSVFYTAINIPYGSLASVISPSAEHRTALSTARSLGSVASSLLIGVAIPVVIYTTDASGNQVVRGEAFPIVAGILSIISFFLFFFCHRLTCERVILPPKKAGAHHSLLKTLHTLIRNRALIGIILVSIFILSAQLLTQSINQYLFIDYFNDKNGIILINLLGILPSLVLAPLAVPLSSKFGKKEIGVIGSLIAAASSFILFFLRTRSVWVYIGISLAGFLGFGLFNLVMWAIVTDIIDDCEVRTGHREDGTIYAVYSFARKLGQALAGGLGGWTLSIIGFDESAVVQNNSVTAGIYTVSTLLPAILYLLVFLSLTFVYPLGKSKVNENVAYLAKKHAK